MALKTFVKVGNITNLSDARYCAGMGVDLLGFPIDDTLPDYLAPASFRAIAEWVAGVQFVGEVADADRVNLTQILQDYQLDWLQVNDITDWNILLQYGIPLIYRVDWAKINTADAFFQQYGAVTPHVSYFLLDSDTDGLSSAALQEILEIAEQCPVLLGFGITSGTVDTIVQQKAVKGIALQGSVEIRPGFKDFGALADMLEALEETD